MRKFLVPALCCFLLAANTSFAQPTPQNDKPYFEVSGIAEKEVMPDELYIGITLRERFEGRNKNTIDQQEAQLKEAVSNLRIDLSNLSLDDAEAAYIRVKMFDKDVIASKHYVLKVATAEMLGNVFKELERLEIKDAGLEKVDYSGKLELKKELRIAAIRSAKEKAVYMTDAIGEKIGKPLHIQEDETGIFVGTHYELDGLAKRSESTGGKAYIPVNQRKMRFVSLVKVKFEIK